MKVLMLSTDKKIFEPNSDVRRRMVEYGKLFDELHVVVFNKRVKNKELRIKNGKISGNVWIYPTSSVSKLLYIYGAYKIGKKILNSKFLIYNSLVTSQDAMTNIVALLLRLKFKFSLQVQIHTDFLNPYFKKESLKNFFYYIGYRLGVRYADCIRVVSKRIHNSLAESGIRNQELRTTTLPIFVDIEKIRNIPITKNLRQKYPQFDFIILMASRLTKEKNIPLAIHAMREIVRKYPQTGLVIVGEGPERKKIELGIRNYELRDNIIIEKWTNELVSYYKTADLFLLTSRYEGYGRTLIEAATCDCPLATTDVGLVGDILKDQESVFVFKQDDVNSLVETLFKIRENKKLISSIVVVARKAIDKTRITHEKYLEKYKASFTPCSSMNPKE